MDDPQLDPGIHSSALDDLGKLNRLSLGAARIWREVAPLYDPNQGLPIRILDVATGGGDLPLELAVLAARDHIPVEICATDISQTALDYARGHAESAAHPGITFALLDALNDELPAGFDAIVNSLFLHHLDPPQVVALLNKMRTATKELVLINDLVRHEVSYLLVWLVTRLFRSPIVRFDGPVSVQAAFTSKELRAMALQAGMNGCDVEARFPCRQLLIWRREQL